MAKKLNENSNTKKEFVAAYNEQLVQIEELKKALADPKDALLAKQNAATLETAEKIVNSNMAETVKTLQTQVETLLGSLVGQVSTGSEELKALNESIDLKKAELKELFDIETKAYSLTALINAEKQCQIEHDANMDARKTELNEMVAELNGRINSLKDELDNRLAEMDRQVLKARENAMNELDYEMARKKVVDNDLWDDEKKIRENNLAETEAELKRRVDAVTVREDKMGDLENKVAEIPTLIEEAKKEAYEDGKSKAETAEGYKIRAIEAKHKSEVEILNNKVEMLTERLEESNKQLEQAKADLKDAYDKINSTAKATVEASGNKAILSQIEASLNKNKNN